MALGDTGPMETDQKDKATWVEILSRSQRVQENQVSPRELHKNQVLPVKC